MKIFIFGMPIISEFWMFDSKLFHSVVVEGKRSFQEIHVSHEAGVYFPGFLSNKYHLLHGLIEKYIMVAGF